MDDKQDKGTSSNAESLEENLTISADDPFRTLHGTGKEPSATPEVVARSRRAPATVPHASQSVHEDDDRTYGGAGVVGQEEDQSTRHDGERRSIDGGPSRG